MSDIMQPLEFKKLLKWILTEYKNENSIFGIPEAKFFRKNNDKSYELLGETCETLIGPAAGPHTQSTANIVAAYLTGSRFFELKTVQILDELEIEKPCIEAGDEGYNTEWSTELTVQQAYQEYVKAWFLIHIVKKMLNLSNSIDKAFIFNMSVGYDLKGIKSSKIDNYIENMRDAADNDFFIKCKTELTEVIKTGQIPKIEDTKFIETISANISNSITLSTMHGCPPEDQEAICRYFIGEKKIPTFVKLNPTLLGYEYVKNFFQNAGFDHITLKEESFTHDMQYAPAVKMLQSLKKYSGEHGVEFGVKLSNTLAVKNDQGKLPTDEMYMSGRTLYPLTINLALKLADEFSGKLPISFSGGANYFNIKQLLSTGIKPITMATNLLKPGGYTRLTQIAEILEETHNPGKENLIDLNKLQEISQNALSDKKYRKEYKNEAPMKIEQNLPKFDCFVAPCTIGCPINQDIPEYIKLVGEKRYEEAFKLIISKNPLPFITGFICDHKCELKCVRNDYEQPVLIREMKRIAAENGFEKILVKLEKPKQTKKGKVAVIGAGPAGLSSAYFLAREGFDVTVFDTSEKIGGTVSNTIPEFRIPRWAIENDIKLIKKMGVKFQTNANPDFDISKLKKDGFQFINIAIGAMKSRDIRIDGENNKIHSAIQFLHEFNSNQDEIRFGKNVAVIGGGNSAMDAARAAKRLKGVENVSIVYRRTKKQMPADREELEAALKDGIIFRELLNPISFENGILKCQEMKLGEIDSSGRRRPVPTNNLVEIKIDDVLTAIGEVVDYDLLQKNGIKLKKWDIITDEFNQTSVENVYISGDALQGPATVVEAIADARKTANGILAKAELSVKTMNTSEYEFDQQKREIEITNKKGKIAEIMQEKDEPARCLECNFICNKCVEVCPNRANLAIKIDSDKFNDLNQILHIDGLCNECGNCETFCPYDDAPYKEKFTLFWNIKDFENSSNDGFVLVKKNKIKLRFEEVIYELISENSKLKYCDSEKNANLKNLVDIISAIKKKYNYLL